MGFRVSAFCGFRVGGGGGGWSFTICGVRWFWGLQIEETEETPSEKKGEPNPPKVKKTALKP